MELKEIIKKRLRELQLDYKSAAAMADHIGIPRQTLDNYLHGERTPTFEILYKICDRCNVSADWLLGLSDVRSPESNMQTACKTIGLDEKTVRTIMSFDSKLFCALMSLPHWPDIMESFQNFAFSVNISRNKEEEADFDFKQECTRHGIMPFEGTQAAVLFANSVGIQLTEDLMQLAQKAGEIYNGES